MRTLEGKRAVVTGGARGIGRTIVDALVRAGAEVVAVGRTELHLGELRAQTGGRVRTHAGDVGDPVFADRVLRETRPDVLVLNAGARPHLAPIQEHTWETFSAAWETDVRGTFHWSRLAMTLPLVPGSTVLISSSGAAIGGSPLSGGYAGAKRMQWIMTDYLQRESNAQKLGIRFHAIIPRTIVEASEMGHEAVTAYARATGLTREKYLERFGALVTPDGLARGMVEILTGPAVDAVGYVVLEDRVQPIGTSLTPSEFGALK